MEQSERVVTGLPYDINLMIERIQNEGAIVDVSQINFPNTTSIDQQVRTTLIYLRNTNFPNTTLDFSRVPQDQFQYWLKGYITSDITFSVPELNEMWLYVLGYYLSGTNYCDYITNETLDQFIEENQQLIDQLIDFYNSLLLYVLKRLTDENVIDFSDVKHQSEVLFSANAYNLLQLDNFSDLTDIIEREPVFFDNLFTETNNELFELIGEHTPYTALLYGMVEDTETFKHLADDIEHVVELSTDISQ